MTKQETTYYPSYQIKTYTEYKDNKLILYKEYNLNGKQITQYTDKDNWSKWIYDNNKTIFSISQTNGVEYWTQRFYNEDSSITGICQSSGYWDIRNPNDSHKEDKSGFNNNPYPKPTEHIHNCVHEIQSLTKSLIIYPLIIYNYEYR